MAYDTYSGASHFANDSSYEVQRGNHYEIVIDLDALQPKFDSTYAEAIRLCCTSAPVPDITITPQGLRHGNETVNVAGSPSWGNMSISIYDVIGRDMAYLLQEWFWRVFDPRTHTMGLVSSYKASATLYLYSPDASTFRKWICYGVFPTSLNFGSYSADSQGAPVSITMGLAVDRTELVPAGGTAIGF